MMTEILFFITLNEFIISEKFFFVNVYILLFTNFIDIFYLKLITISQLYLSILIISFIIKKTI